MKVSFFMMKMVRSILVFLLPVALASAQTVVKGVITGYHGQPLPVANVSVSPHNVDRIVKSVAASKNGEFEITLDSKGVWLLRFSGAYHENSTVAIFADTPKTINLSVKLATCRYNKNFDEVKLLGNFNKWYPPAAIVMKEQPDSAFVAEIETDVDTVIYQLTGITAGNVPGTEADRFTYDEYHGYNAVLIASPGKVRIVFDPKKLLSSDEPARFTFSDSNSAESRFAQVYNETQRWNSEYVRAEAKYIASRRSAEKSAGFDYENVFSTIKAQLANERNDIVRQELELTNFMFLLKQGRADSVNSVRVLKDIPPSSAVWSLGPLVIPAAFNYSGYKEKREDDYVQQVINENPSVEAVSSLLSAEFMKKLYGEKKEQAIRYYDIAVNQYGDTPGGEQVANYRSVSGIDVGKEAPVFSVASTWNPKKHFTSRLFKGKFCLMDFWSTGNKRSIDEIKNLQIAYEEFKSKGLVVLSLSIDSSRQAVTDFERVGGKIPWYDAYVDKGFGSRTCKDYEVYAIPKPILIDPHGKVVAVGLDLRGDRLMKTLEKFLGEKEPR